jgi:hypothetical protein
MNYRAAVVHILPTAVQIRWCAYIWLAIGVWDVSRIQTLATSLQRMTFQIRDRFAAADSFHEDI